MATVVMRVLSLAVRVLKYWSAAYIELLKEAGSGKAKDFPRRIVIKCRRHVYVNLFKGEVLCTQN